MQLAQRSSVGYAISIALHALFFVGLLWSPLTPKVATLPGPIKMRIAQPEKHAAAPSVVSAAKPTIPKHVPIEKKTKAESKTEIVTQKMVESAEVTPIVPSVPGTMGVGENDFGTDDLESDSQNDDGDDKSSIAILIRSSLPKPEYTPEALYAGVEGLFPLDVQLDDQGKVLQAKLAKPVGFEMDQRIIVAVLAAKFEPARDSKGRAIAGWTKVKFKLEIPR